MKRKRGHFMKVYQKKSLEHRGFLYTKREIAEYMGVCPSTVTRLIKSSALPVARQGNGLFFTSKQLLDQWILAVYNKQRGNRE